MKACRVLSASAPTLLCMVVLFGSMGAAQSLKEGNEVLLEQIQRVHGSSDNQMESVRAIFRASPYIGQGNPAITRHPMTPDG